MVVVYPVCIFEEKDGGYVVNIPDLNKSTTEGDTLEEALCMAEDLIAGYILKDVEDIERNEIPKASRIEEINLKEISDYLEYKEDTIREFKTLVRVDLARFAEKWSTKAIKKTLTIPKWLNTRAERSKYKFF